MNNNDSASGAPRGMDDGRTDRAPINDLFSPRLVTDDRQACNYPSRSLIAPSVTISSRRGVGWQWVHIICHMATQCLTNVRESS